MREIIQLFSDRDSRDELGLGQIRDAISDGLFPGTSTLLTRARYLLFVPWCLQLAAQKPNPLKAADQFERALIGTVKDTSDTAGLLGMRAGAALRNLPSAVYWSMLRHYGILTDPDMSRADATQLPQLLKSIDDLDTDETAKGDVWSPSMPPAPANFPREAPGGFALTREEAEWLRDRILDGAPNTLMSHLLTHSPAADSAAPWLDEAALRADGRVRTWLEHAQAFSAVMQGAQLLYNLLIAQEYETAGFDRLDAPVASYLERLERWAETLPSNVNVHTWDLAGLLRTAEVERGSPIHPSTRRFVEEWTTLVQTTGASSIADDPTARAFLVRRERQHKGAQARIGNRARLASWGGKSGAAAMTFRWTTSRGILTDIHEGLAH